MNTVQTRRAKWGETALIRSFVVFVFFSCTGADASECRWRGQGRLAAGY